MKRTLVLTRESLTELTPFELSGVAGAALPTQDLARCLQSEMPTQDLGRCFDSQMPESLHCVDITRTCL